MGRAGHHFAAWETPLGRIGADFSGDGVRQVRLPDSDPVRQPGPGPVRRIGNEIVTGAARDVLESLECFFSAYFKCSAAAAPMLDETGRRPFERAVWAAARRIEFGRTMTYGELARAMGRDGAARAVGGALGRNPLALLTPCHRIVALGRGNLLEHPGGFSGLLTLKLWLLHHETAI